MSAIAIQQPDHTWHIVQLNAKGYAVVRENIRTSKENQEPAIKLIDLLRAKKVHD